MGVRPFSPAAANDGSPPPCDDPDAVHARFDPWPIYSRQHSDLAVLKSRHHLPQRDWLDHLDRIAPRV